MLRKILILALCPILLLSTTFASPQKYRRPDGVDGTILLGQYYAFILAEPNGWNLDTSAGKSDSLDAVLYPDGSSWADGTAVMYVRVTYKDSKTKRSMQQVIENDIEEFKQRNKDSTVSTMPSYLTRDKKKAEMRNFYDAEHKNQEAVAYIDEPKLVVILVLTSRNKDEYSKSLPAFKDLVASYFFVNELSNVK